MWQACWLTSDKGGVDQEWACSRSQGTSEVHDLTVNDPSAAVGVRVRSLGSPRRQGDIGLTVPRDTQRHTPTRMRDCLMKNEYAMRD